jgi:hypothetical protein
MISPDEQAPLKGFRAILDGRGALGANVWIEWQFAVMLVVSSTTAD